MEGPLAMVAVETDDSGRKRARATLSSCMMSDITRPQAAEARPLRASLNPGGST